MKSKGNNGLAKSFVVIFLILFADQLLKFWVKLHMTLGQDIPVFGRWFRLLFIENNGMAFGWLDGGGLKLALSIFRILAVVILLIILVRLSRKNTKFGVLFGIALIIAGAMGNILDSVFFGRIFSASTFTEVATMFPDGGGYANWLHGRVVDMLYFPIIDVTRDNATWLPSFLFGPDDHFIFFRPIFNLADSAITIGVLYLLIFQWKNIKKL